MSADSEHTIEFLDSFAGLDDPRRQAKVLYPLEEVLLLCPCAVLGGADGWVEVAPSPGPAAAAVPAPLLAVPARHPVA